jgi:hypothetical protein
MVTADRDAVAAAPSTVVEKIEIDVAGKYRVRVGGGVDAQSRLFFEKRPLSWFPRRHSLRDDLGPTPYPDVAGGVPPYCFVQEIQRALGVICFADYGGAGLQDQLDFEFSHGPAFQKRLAASQLRLPKASVDRPTSRSPGRGGVISRACGGLPANVSAAPLPRRTSSDQSVTAGPMPSIWR